MPIWRVFGLAGMMIAQRKDDGHQQRRHDDEQHQAGDPQSVVVFKLPHYANGVEQAQVIHGTASQGQRGQQAEFSPVSQLSILPRFDQSGIIYVLKASSVGFA
jgi:hypothetical protein